MPWHRYFQFLNLHCSESHEKKSAVQDLVDQVILSCSLTIKEEKMDRENKYDREATSLTNSN